MLTRHISFTLLLTLIVLAGCAGRRAEEYAPSGKGNLEPEITELDALKQSRGRPLTENEKKILASHTDIKFKLNVQETEEERRFFSYFNQDKRSTVQAWLGRSEPYLLYVRAVLASQGVPQDLVVLPFIESGYNNMALSSSGAAGMWQFMPFTGRKYCLTVDWWVDERRNPYLSSVAAAKYLSELYRNFGDWQLALAAYNAGEGRVSRAMAKSGAASFNHLAKDQTLLAEETRHYVPKFLAMLKIFRNLRSLGFHSPSLNQTHEVEELNAPGGTDLLGLARSAGMDWSEFSALNPSFRRQMSPPDRTTSVYIPKARASRAVAFLNQPPSGPKSGCKTYLTQKEETWWSVSRRTGVPLAELRKLNSGLPETLGPGRNVLIPSEASTQDILYAEAEAAPKQAAKTGWDHPQTAYGKPAPYSPAQSAQAGPANAQPAQVAQASYAPAAPAQQASSTPAQPVSYAAAPALQSGQVVSYASLLAKDGTSQGSSVQSAAASAQSASQSGRSSHQVAPGETLFAICKKYGVSQAELLRANGLESAAQIKSGISLVIPAQEQAFNKTR